MFLTPSPLTDPTLWGRLAFERRKQMLSFLFFWFFFCFHLTSFLLPAHSGKLITPSREKNRYWLLAQSPLGLSQKRIVIWEVFFLLISCDETDTDGKQGTAWVPLRRLVSLCHLFKRWLFSERPRTCVEGRRKEVWAEERSPHPTLRKEERHSLLSFCFLRSSPISFKPS